MRIINQKIIKEQLNNCYKTWDPQWKSNIGDINIVNAFKYHLAREAGLQLDFEVQVRFGQVGYKIHSIKVVDDEAFMMWMLTWS